MCSAEKACNCPWQKNCFRSESHDAQLLQSMKSDLRTAVEDSRLASHLYAGRSLFDKKGCIRYNKRNKERLGCI